jgi:hypothetical protein
MFYHCKAATAGDKRQHHHADAHADASEATSSSDEGIEESEDNAQSLFKPQESSREEPDNCADESSRVLSDSDFADAESLKPGARQLVSSSLF